MLTIQNISRRIQVYNLDAGAFQEMDGPHGYKLQHVVVVDHAKDGTLTGRRLPRMLPASITFLADEIKSGLPDAMLEVSAIKSAIEKREIRVVSQTADEPVEQKPTPPPPDVKKAESKAPKPSTKESA